MSMEIQQALLWSSIITQIEHTQIRIQHGKTIAKFNKTYHSCIDILIFLKSSN